jgi:hypothetical protein
LKEKSTWLSRSSVTAKVATEARTVKELSRHKPTSLSHTIPYTSYIKVENNTRDIAIDELERFAGYFGMTIDQVVHFDNQPVEVTIQDKPNFEQINMINQLDEDDRTVVFKIIDTMLTKKKFKDFFNNNMAAL